MSLRADSARLAARLDAIPGEVLAELRPALIRSAEEVADKMRALVPVEEGDLKASITVTPPLGTTPAYAEGGGRRTAGPNQALVTAGAPKVRHGHFMEFGTVKMAPRPFMRPAWRLAKARIERRVKRAISLAIKRAAGG